MQQVFSLSGGVHELPACASCGSPHWPTTAPHCTVQRRQIGSGPVPCCPCADIPVGFETVCVPWLPDRVGKVGSAVECLGFEQKRLHSLLVRPRRSRVRGANVTSTQCVNKNGYSGIPFEVLFCFCCKLSAAGAYSTMIHLRVVKSFLLELVVYTVHSDASP